MYIDHVHRKPTIREANRLETVQAKNVNIKKLKLMDKQASEAYNNAKNRGGRLYLGRGFGSWLKKFKKVGNFAKTAFNKVLKPAYKNVIKPGLNFLTKSELGKELTQGAASIIGSAVSAIPVAGPVAGPIVSKVLPQVLETTDNITTSAEKIVQGIRDKNPQITIQQAKEIVGTIKDTYNKLDSEAKKVKEEQTNKAIEKLPDTIKAEGFESVLKAAPFLPLVDLTTLRETTTEGRGGKIRQQYKIRKPTGADKFGKYNANIVGRIAGRIFLSGACGKSSNVTNVDKELKANNGEKPKAKNNKSLELLENLRAKYK